MKVIIMAAGVGSRLGALAGGKPKCLIPAGDETLIHRIIRLCNERGIDDISVVTGYESHVLEAELEGQAEIVFNPFYRVTDSISSLWLARHKLADDHVIVMDGDLFFEERAFDELLAQTKPVVLLSDSTRIETADFRYSWDGDKILRYGKDLSNDETDGENVGIARLDASFVPIYLQRLNEMIAGGQINGWWESVLFSFIPEGLPICHHDIAGIFWTEIDHMQDYERLQAFISAGKA